MIKHSEQTKCDKSQLKEGILTYLENITFISIKWRSVYDETWRLEDYPETLEYGKNMDVLRTELREYFWDGEFRHEVGAAVTEHDGKPYHPHSVFINQETGKSGVVICIYDEKKPVTVYVKLESGMALNRYRYVDGVDWLAASDGIFLPPCSAAVAID